METTRETTITTSNGQGLQPGDVITMTVPDRRWWRVLLWRLMRRPGEPRRQVKRRVDSVSGSTFRIG